MTLLLIIITLVIIGSGGLVYYTTTIHPAALNAQATAVAQNFLTAQAMTPAGIYAQATSSRPVINDPLSSPNNSAWQSGVGCTFTGGAYHVAVNGASNGTCSARGTFSNFAFQVQVTVIKGIGGGLGFRLDGVRQRGYVFAISISGFYALALLESNSAAYSQGRTLSSSPDPAIKIGLNQSNLLTVIARGSDIYLYINKQFVTSVYDNASSSGQIGLFTGIITASSAEVAFSNAQVWQL